MNHYPTLTVAMLLQKKNGISSFKKMQLFFFSGTFTKVGFCQDGTLLKELEVLLHPHEKWVQQHSTSSFRHCCWSYQCRRVCINHKISPSSAPAKNIVMRKSHINFSSIPNTLNSKRDLLLAPTAGHLALESQGKTKINIQHEATKLP